MSQLKPKRSHARQGTAPRSRTQARQEPLRFFLESISSNMAFQPGTIRRWPPLLILIALASAFLALSASAQPTFSHQLHLNKVGLTCTDCHVSAPSSTKATDNNFPEETVCLKCHDGKKAKTTDTSFLAKQEPAPRIIRFNHEFHLQMGNLAPVIAAAIDDNKYLGKVGDIRRHLNTENACAACHRGLDETDAATSANLPQMSDCLVCHDRIDNPFSCEKCHLEGVNLKPANHTNDFLDRHSTGKLGLDKTTCLPCHGKSFTCMGCH